MLCTRGLVKKHSVGKKPAYELLPSGQEMAVRLKGEGHLYGNCVFYIVLITAMYSLSGVFLSPINKI